jgi:hypothetical protein
MWTTDVLKHFGSINKTAKALAITRQAIQGWREVVPMGRAYQLQALTKGKLKVKPECYNGHK